MYLYRQKRLGMVDWVPSCSTWEQECSGDTHLKLPGVDPVVTLYEGVAQVVDAEALQALKGAVVKVQVVRVPGM